MQARALYAKLEVDRTPYLNRGRDCAKLTIPTLLPDDGDNGSTVYDTPYQSVGARGVTNLSSALLLSLLPPNQPFFRLLLDESALDEIEGVPGAKAEIDAALGKIERSVMKEIEINSFRVALSEALKQLIVAGNVLLHVPEKGGMRVFRLDRYVAQRDPMGNLRQIVIKEDVAPETLPKDVQEFLSTLEHSATDKSSCELYTVATWDSGYVHVHQEIYDHTIPGSEGKYKQEESPFFALRFVAEQGSPFGRGYVEEYYGDLQSLEGLSRAITEGSAAAAKVLFMCSPNGTTRPRDVARSSNGAIISGNSQDVTVLQMNKFADFRVALETMNQISERLNYAFLLAETAIRKAERVTAEEVRLVSAAVERSLGGLYSVLSQEFSLPLVRRVMARMTKAKKLPKVPDKYVSPTVTVGMDQLARGQDLARLDTFVAGMAQVLGPESLRVLRQDEYLRRRAAALSIDATGLIKTEEEMMQEMQAAQQDQMMQAVAPQVAGPLAKAAGDSITEASQGEEL